MRILFIGTGAIGRPALHALCESTAHELVGVVTQPDKPVGREQLLQSSPIKTAVVGTSIPVLQPRRIGAEEAIAQVAALAPDLIVVMAYGQILPRRVLEIPKIACLNLHASLLPRHRGAAPIQAAIVTGDRETGITVIYMDEGLDTGDILLQKAMPILPDDTGGSLHDRLAQLAPEALLEALASLANGAPARIPQDEARATYAPKLSRTDGRIDWKEPAALIARKIRAYDPWPGAFTEVEDAAGQARHLKIFRATPSEEQAGAPATISLPNDREILVGAGQGSLHLEEVQLEGRRRMEAAEFLRGFSSPRLHF